MKYTIARQFSFKNEKFEIVSGSKTVCTVKATSSKEHGGRFNIIISNQTAKRVGKDDCIVEPDPVNSRNYLIYIENTELNDKTLFGQLSYELCSYDNYLYTIVIGKKCYKVRSNDLKNRHLSIIDTLEQIYSCPLEQYSAAQCPQTLFQVTDLFSKSTKTYHVTVNDKDQHFGYLAIVILLDLLECR